MKYSFKTRNIDLSITLTVILLSMLMAVCPGFSLAGEENGLKNFSIIGKAEPVPGHLKTGFESITGKEADAYIRFLASDLLEGRQTGSKGFAIASAYAASLFRAWGIQPAGDLQGKQRSYFQGLEVKQIESSSSRITAKHTRGRLVRSWLFDADKDYMFYPRVYPSEKGTISAPVVFAGYGIQEKSLNYDDYKTINAGGKVVMVLMGVPGGENPDSPFNKGPLKEKYVPGQRSLERIFGKIALARSKGAAAVLLVERHPSRIYREKLAAGKVDDAQPFYSGEARPLLAVDAAFQGRTQAPYMRIGREMANVIVGYAGNTIEALKGKIDKEFKANSLALPGVTLEIESRLKTKLAGCRNVLGYIEGSDPVLKDEVVAIGAHLDHLGKEKDYIYNGADDNGSGSAALLEIAQAFIANPVKPKRTILFALWTGEEWEYQGSNFYVKHPSFPLKKTVAYLNLDMVSREWTWELYRETLQAFHGIELPEKKPEKLDLANFLPMEVLQSPKYMDILKKNNRYVGLHSHFIDVPGVIQGSDHLPFANHHIPWINSFGGETEDYHTPFDSVEKINVSLLEKGARLTWLTAFALADSSK